MAMALEEDDGTAVKIPTVRKSQVNLIMMFDIKKKNNF